MCNFYVPAYSYIVWARLYEHAALISYMVYTSGILSGLAMLEECSSLLCSSFVDMADLQLKSELIDQCPKSPIMYMDVPLDDLRECTSREFQKAYMDAWKVQN